MLDFYRTQLGETDSLISLERKYFILSLGGGILTDTRSWNDAAYQYFRSWNGGEAGSLNDEAFKYYSSLSGLTPAANYSLRDHMIEVFAPVSEGGLGGPGVSAPITDQLEAMYMADYPDGYAIDNRISKNIASADNTTFEGSAGTWVNSQNCTVARSTTVAYEGSASLAITSTAGGTVVARTPNGLNAMPITAGQTYTAVAQVRSAAVARSMRIGVAWVDGAGVYISDAPVGSSAVTSSTSAWTKSILQAVTAPSNAAYAYLTFVIGSVAGAGEIHYIDQVGLWSGTSTDWVLPGKLHNINMLTDNQATVEDDASGYTSPYGATLARSTAQFVSGSSSLALTGTQTNGSYAQSNTAANGIAVTAGKTYTAVAKIRAATTVRSCHVDIIWFNAAGGTVTTSTGGAATNSNSAWTSYTKTVVAPVGAVSAGVIIAIEPVSAIGEVHYVDEIGLWEGNVTTWVPPYKGKALINDYAPVDFLRDLSGKNRHALPAASINQPRFRKPNPGTSSKNLLTYNQATAEFDTTGIANSTNCNVTRTTAQFLTGVASISMSSVAGGNMACQWGVSGSIRAPVTAGTSYTAIAYVRSAVSARVVSIDILWFSALLGGFISTSTATITATDNTTGWVKIQNTATAPATAIYATVIVNVASTGGAAEVHYVDNVGIWPTQTNNANLDWQAPGLFFYNLLSYNQATVETDTTGLTSNGNCAVARSTAQALHGIGSLSLTSSASGDMSAITSTGLVAVTPSTTYTGVASIRSAVSARSCRVELRWFDAAQALISTTLGTAANDSTSAWTSYTVSGAAPSNAAYAALIVRVLSTGAASEVHYADQLGISAGEHTVWKPPVTIPNNRPIIQFDGVNHVLQVPISLLSSVNARTLYVVSALDAENPGRSFQDPFALFVGGGASMSAIRYQLSDDSWRAVFRRIQADTAAQVFRVGDTPATYQVMSANVDTASDGVIGFWHNGVAGTNGAPFATSTGQTEATVTVSMGGGAGQLQGAVAAVLAYSAKHTATQRQQIERWLGSLYGVTVA